MINVRPKRIEPVLRDGNFPCFRKKTKTYAKTPLEVIVQYNQLELIMHPVFTSSLLLLIPLQRTFIQFFSHIISYHISRYPRCLSRDEVKILFSLIKFSYPDMKHAILWYLSDQRTWELPDITARMTKSVHSNNNYKTIEFCVFWGTLDLLGKNLNFWFVNNKQYYLIVQVFQNIYGEKSRGVKKNSVSFRTMIQVGTRAKKWLTPYIWFSIILPMPHIIPPIGVHRVPWPSIRKIPTSWNMANFKKIPPRS